LAKRLELFVKKSKQKKQTSKKSVKLFYFLTYSQFTYK